MNKLKQLLRLLWVEDDWGNHIIKVNPSTKLAPLKGNQEKGK